MITGSASFFCLYRLYMVAGNPAHSIVFVAASYLCTLCLFSLMRISVGSRQFQTLQNVQERLIGQQKLFMKCRRNEPAYRRRAGSRGLHGRATLTQSLVDVAAGNASNGDFSGITKMASRSMQSATATEM